MQAGLVLDAWYLVVRFRFCSISHYVASVTRTKETFVPVSSTERPLK
jgi:hypothetical protein